MRSPGPLLSSQAAEQDYDKDGLTDVIDVRVTARGIQGYNVHSVKMLMTFDYQLNVSPTPPQNPHALPRAAGLAPAPVRSNTAPARPGPRRRE